jgi:hypothetical protein
MIVRRWQAEMLRSTGKEARQFNLRFQVPKLESAVHARVANSPAKILYRYLVAQTTWHFRSLIV